MRNPIETMGIYERELRSSGGQRGKLLDVLDQALHHNFPNSYHLGMMVGLFTDDDDKVLDSVTRRVALVNRHVVDAQKALREIYEVAKERGYHEITAIFERDYPLGHSESREKPVDKDDTETA